MVSKDNIIGLLFQIGFRELDEHEIVFNGFSDKLSWRKGEKRILEYNDYEIVIDFNNNTFELSGKPSDGSSLYFSTSSYLDTGMKDIYIKLKSEFKSEMRKILIAKLLK